MKYEKVELYVWIRMLMGLLFIFIYHFLSLKIGSWAEKRILYYKDEYLWAGEEKINGMEKKI